MPVAEYLSDSTDKLMLLHSHVPGLAKALTGYLLFSEKWTQGGRFPLPMPVFPNTLEFPPLFLSRPS